MVAFIVAVAIAYGSVSQFGAVQSGAEEQKVFVVEQGKSTIDIINQLKELDIIKSKIAFRIFHAGGTEPGGYLLSKGMTAREIANTLEGDPKLVWVTIPEGLRKEQIASILAEKLGWDEETEKKWVTNHTAMTLDTIEGVYFPDTYLIPLSDTPFQVAERMRHRFNDRFAPLAQKAIDENIKWTTLVKVASLVQREAAGKEDMPIIAGIIWNRLDRGMKLEIDATVQYAVDTYKNYDEEAQAWELTYHGEKTKSEEWWQPMKAEDKKINSAVNTYLHKGLPSRPISNPGMDAIQAALFPEETDCLYYLHDSQRAIHCTTTYEDHQANITRYLR